MSSGVHSLNDQRSASILGFHNHQYASAGAGTPDPDIAEWKPLLHPLPRPASLRIDASGEERVSHPLHRDDERRGPQRDPARCGQVGDPRER
jgi:hypothetical protein